MTGSRLLHLLLLAAAIVAATIAGGWSGVPLVAFLGGAFRRNDATMPVLAGAAAVAAWAALLTWQGTTGPVLRVADRVAGAFGAPGAVLLGVALLFAFALAWSAAELGRGAMRFATGEARRR